MTKVKLNKKIKQITQTAFEIWQQNFYNPAYPVTYIDSQFDLLYAEDHLTATDASTIANHLKQFFISISNIDK